jgi:hypothetical protein
MLMTVTEQRSRKNKRYVAGGMVPKTIGPGRVLMHNHVIHGTGWGCGIEANAGEADSTGLPPGPRRRQETAGATAVPDGISPNCETDQPITAPTYREGCGGSGCAIPEPAARIRLTCPSPSGGQIPAAIGMHPAEGDQCKGDLPADFRTIG